MIGKFVRKMNESVTDFLSTHREELCFPMSVSIEPDRTTGSLRKRNTGRLIARDNVQSVNGETKQLKSDRVEFIVPFIRIGESYLAGEGRLLNISLNLPNGNVQMQVIGQTYEMVGRHTSVAKFLIGAKIVYMSETDRDLYQFHLSGTNFTNTERAAFALHITQR
ncbi:MAG: hypothetical protein MUC29_13120 [Pyrinomonadaceae bacterium]|jgi:hypothetical protein|nr:hypothetical protein [Pyrinomonadaceae bacterium]